MKINLTDEQIVYLQHNSRDMTLKQISDYLEYKVVSEYVIEYLEKVMEQLKFVYKTEEK